MDLVLRNATVMGATAKARQDVGVIDGKIVEIAPKIMAIGREELDLDGRLLTPGLVESHIHLDKSRIIDRCGAEAGRHAANTVKRVQAAKRDFTVEDVYARAKATPEAMDIHGVMELTERHRYGGRVNVGHVTKLSTLPPERQAPIARRLAESGVAVTVLPATDLFLMGRDQNHDVRRGIVDVNAYDRLGVTCSIANNNILNPFTPFGDCSLIRMANLHANTLQVSSPDDLKACFEMVSSDAAQILNLRDYGIAVGHPADFAVLDAKNEADAVAVIAPVLSALKRGRRTVSRPRPELHHPG